MRGKVRAGMREFECAGNGPPMTGWRCSMTRRSNIALVSLIAVVGGALGYLPASAQLTPAAHQSLPFEKLVVPTTLAWSVLPPSIAPVLGTDGRTPLAS